ncbi:hypothetical protein [Klebsiella phage IME184]|jgi:hypothetical protein|uniref:Uncharacterized protein n=1 Tax=Klebsiella phage IME184 TaxID=2860373 RepID=A0AC61NAI3_9CAUD|nr:hypothetical protein [Klebsiella phage IME184]UNI76961.1 hypothetical protein KpnPVR702_9 [Klebsiella phage KpnP_VR702]
MLMGILFVIGFILFVRAGNTLQARSKFNKRGYNVVYVGAGWWHLTKDGCHWQIKSKDFLRFAKEI